MERHPNEYWLKYLLCICELSNRDVSSMCSMYGMPTPSTGYLSDLASTLNQTKPSRFDIDRPDCARWVRRQRFMSLAKEDRDAVAARSALQDSKVRRALECLLLANTDIELIPEYILELCGQQMTRKSVDLFRHYFWNRELLNTGQWMSYLEGHHDEEIYWGCYANGEMFALWKLGAKVDIDGEDVLRDILRESAMRFKETSSQPNSRDTALTAKLWAENVFKATDELNRTGDAVGRVLDGLRDVAIRLGNRRISSVEELGNIDSE